MNRIRLYTSIISELPVKMSDAGFSDGNMDSFLKEMPRRNFSNPPEGLLRWLYLAFLGLAEFTLKLGTVDMFSAEKYWEEELKEFRNPPFRKIHPDDKKFGWNMEFDLSKLTLHPAIPANWKKKQVTLKSALASFQKFVPENLRANYWHGLWLHLHQEFIPDDWKKAIKGTACGRKGRIIFPGVRLISTREDCEIIQYPYLGIGIDFNLDMQISYGSFPEVVGKNDHFACFRE